MFYDLLETILVLGWLIILMLEQWE